MSTDGQKAMHKSPPRISTGGLENQREWGLNILSRRGGKIHKFVNEEEGSIRIRKVRGPEILEKGQVIKIG